MLDTQNQLRMTDLQFEEILNEHVGTGTAYLTRNPAETLAKLETPEKQAILEAALFRMHTQQGEFSHRVRKLAGALLREGTPAHEKDIAGVLDTLAGQRSLFTCFPLSELVDWVEYQEANNGLSVRLLTSLRKHLPMMEKLELNKAHRLLMRRLSVAVKLTNEWVIPEVRDAWTAVALAKRDTLLAESSQRWVSILELASKQTTSKPSQSYLKAAGAIAETMPEFPGIMREIIESIGRDGPVGVHRFGFRTDKKHLLDEDYTDLLRALLWLSVPYGELAEFLRGAAERCCVKIKGVGPLSSKIAGACALVLSQQEGTQATRAVFEIQNAAKHKTTKKGLEKAIAKIEKRSGTGRDVLEETSVPDLGFTRDDPPTCVIGGDIMTLAVSKAGAPVLLEQGRPACSAEAKDLLREVRRIWRHEVLRLERLLRNGRQVSAKVWLEHYLGHPITGQITRRLLWMAREDLFGFTGHSTKGMIMVKIAGSLHKLSESEEVRLWHPCELTESQRLAWERWVLQKRLIQPFQQAQRVINQMMPGTEHQTDDSRFTGELIHQGTFAALCRERGWTYSFHGGKTQYEPTLEFSGIGLRAALKVEEAPQVGWLRIVSVKFYTGKSSASPTTLKDVPVILFSEALRDVDLFITASRVKQPGWKDAIPENERE